MVRHNEPIVKENLRGGKGHVVFYHILEEKELMGHGSMYARVVIPPHCSIGWHQHIGNTRFNAGSGTAWKITVRKTWK